MKSKLFFSFFMISIFSQCLHGMEASFARFCISQHKSPVQSQTSRAKEKQTCPSYPSFNRTSPTDSNNLIYNSSFQGLTPSPTLDTADSENSDDEVGILETDQVWLFTPKDRFRRPFIISRNEVTLDSKSENQGFIQDGESLMEGTLTDLTPQSWSPLVPPNREKIAAFFERLLNKPQRTAE